jgi:hypothetical protein
MRSHSLAVEASVSPLQESQAAIVAIAVSDEFHILFDAVDTSQKTKNLRKNPNIAFVIGGWAEGDERTVQYKGIASEPSGKELDSLKEIYFKKFPNGRERQNWPGLTYINVRPLWIRYSDFNKTPPQIIEFSFEDTKDGSE